MAIAPSSTPAMGSQAPGTVVMVPLCSVFRRYLKSLDLKYTTERADILDAVMRLDRVFEADELLKPTSGVAGGKASGGKSAAGKPRVSSRVSKATVYRTLKLLVEAGILAELQLDRERTHYQLVYGKPPSDFAICVQSGQRVEFTNPRVGKLCDELLRELGWQPLGHRLQLYGIAPPSK